MKFFTSHVNKYIAICKNKQTLRYPETDLLLYKALDKYSIKGHTTLVIGSRKPCYEAVAFAYGSSQVITIEYSKISSRVINLNTMTVDEFNIDTNTYDSALSISSVEHSGLGRYGDPIDPDGDLKAMALLRERIKPKGLCFLAVPIGNDRIEGNKHRVYGKERLPKLVSGWTILDRFGFDQSIFNSDTIRNQPIFVLEKN